MSRENVQVVLGFFDAFNSRDTAAIGEMWSADGEWRPALMGGGVVEGAVYRGHDGIAEFVAAQAETWESASVEPIAIRDVGDSVLVEVGLRAVGRTSGVPLQGIIWNVFHLRAGKIMAGRVYLRYDEALEAVGLRE